MFCVLFWGGRSPSKKDRPRSGNTHKLKFSISAAQKACWVRDHSETHLSLRKKLRKKKKKEERNYTFRGDETPKKWSSENAWLPSGLPFKVLSDLAERKSSPLAPS